MSAGELLWSQSAVGDLQMLRKWLGRDAPSYAERLTERIFASIERIPAFPRIGRLVAEVGDDAVRELLLRTLRIVYRAEEGRIVILAILEGGRAIERRESRRWEL